MKIDDAIEQLQNAKKEGTKNIILAWWNSGEFDRQDNDAWAIDCDIIDDNMAPWLELKVRVCGLAAVDRLYEIMENEDDDE